MKINFKKILKNEKKGYTLMYSLIALVVCCALVFSTVSISLYYNNNLSRKTGSRGALMSAQSGIEVTEDYLNYCYKEFYGLSYDAEELYTRIYDILNDLIVTGELGSGSDLCGLILQGYSNYAYSHDAASGISAKLIPENQANISYKTYYSKLLMNNIKTRGELTILSLGEYVMNNKAYYKFITVTVLIEPNYNDDGLIDSFNFKTIQYNETLKGGTDLWGNVQW